MSCLWGPSPQPSADTYRMDSLAPSMPRRPTPSFCIYPPAGSPSHLRSHPRHGPRSPTSAQRQQGAGCTSDSLARLSLSFLGLWSKPVRLFRFVGDDPDSRLPGSARSSPPGPVRALPCPAQRLLLGCTPPSRVFFLSFYLNPRNCTNIGTQNGRAPSSVSRGMPTLGLKAWLITHQSRPDLSRRSQRDP